MLTTDEAALIAEVVHDEIIEFMEEVDVSREIFPIVNKDEGDSVKIVREGTWPDAQVVAEGAEVPAYRPAYTEVTETYRKVAYRVQITHEMVTDARWDLLARGTRKAAQMLAQKMSIESSKKFINY